MLPRIPPSTRTAALETRWTTALMPTATMTDTPLMAAAALPYKPALTQEPYAPALEEARRVPAST